MTEYDELRKNYKPDTIKVLFIAESQPPVASKASSRHFYRADQVRRDDRLFTNTIRALYPEVAEAKEAEIQENKEAWLQRFKADGFYMIETLPNSLVHEVTKEERQELIKEHLPALLERVRTLAAPGTKVILIKSNVFVVAAEPLRQAGYNVLNTALLDYPGRFNQRAYREKLASLLGV